MRTATFIVLFAAGVLTLPLAADEINFGSLSGNANVTNGFGNTATVSVSYQMVDSSGNAVSGFTSQLPLWTPYIFNYYGDLGVVAYVSQGSGVATGGDYGEITLTPAAGDSVTVDSFDIAPFVGTGPTNQLFQVLDQSGTALASYTNQTVSTSTHVTYSPDVTSDGPLTIEFGPSGNVGINDIFFSTQAATSAVPEPSSLGTCLLLASALLLAAWWRARPRVAKV